MKTTIVREVVMGDPITDEQRETLYEVATTCPVARWLEGDIVIDTVLRNANE
jgi:putative redox protein